MKYVFLRFGKVGVPGHVGFITDKFGSLVTSHDITEALEYIDYSKMGASAAIHWAVFNPTAYEFEAQDDRHMMEIIRDGLADSQHRYHRKHLLCQAGSVYVILFPDGQDPFKNAVKAEKIPKPTKIKENGYALP